MPGVSGKTGRPSKKFPAWPDNPHSQQNADGGPNPFYWMHELESCNVHYVACTKKGIEWTGFSQRVKGIIDTAKAFGCDLTTIGQASNPFPWEKPDDLFEMTEKRISEIQTQMYRVLEYAARMTSDPECVSVYRNMAATMTEDGKKKARRYLKMLETVALLQKACRQRLEPPEYHTISTLLSDGERAKPRLQWPINRQWGNGVYEMTMEFQDYIRPLLMQVYVMRTTMTGYTPVMEIRRHHADACFKIERDRKAGVKVCMVTMPPGHGKTDMMIAIQGFWLQEDPNEHIGYAHRTADGAGERVCKLWYLMSPNNPTGRRYHALYPHVQVLGKEPKSQSLTKISLKRDILSKDPTVRAIGVLESGEGRDLSKLIGDDISRQRDRDEPTTREQIYNAWIGTWMKRLRGQHTFTVMVYTIWHQADPNSRMLDGVQRDTPVVGLNDPNLHVYSVGKTMEDGTFDKFYPLWDRYDRKFLIQAYAQSPTLYSCCYLNQPVAEDSCVVKNLRYVEFNPDGSDADRKQAMTFEWILSVDPTMSVGKSSDKAGIVYAALDPVQKRIIVVDAWEIAAAHRDLCEWIRQFMDTPGRRVDKIIMERVNSHATFDLLSNEYGLADRMIAFHPQNKTLGGKKGSAKIARLKSVAMYLEKGRICFAGVMRDGEVRGDPDKLWFYSQILEAEAARHDHALDAVTQMGFIYRHILGDAMGMVADGDESEKLERIRKADPRITKAIETFRRQLDAEQSRTPWRSFQEEMVFAGGVN